MAHSIGFCKYHGLGNDYIVLDPAEVGQGLSPERIRRICHRNYGIGSDGILLGPPDGNGPAFGVKIFNPDGSEAEKSGNGLRIFSRYLWDKGLVADDPFEISTVGGTVRAHIRDGGGSVTVEMGGVSFRSERIPVAGEPRDVLDEELAVLDRTFRFCAASIGNPHCVVLLGGQQMSTDDVCRYGAVIETDARFPNRTNVQFMNVLDRGSIRIEIWERGAGYTLASGSSSCASAAVAHRMGLCDREITVHMPGGQLEISIGEGYAVTMGGPVAKVCEGVISEEMFADGIV